MKYQVGDRVLILHSNEEGEVVDIINKDMMMVDVKGVVFPVYMDQVDFPYFRRFTEKKSGAAPKGKTYVDELSREKARPQKREEDGVWLNFLPVTDTDEFGDEVVEELKIYLVNHTHSTYQFVYRLNFFGDTGFELKNQVAPFENFYLHDIPFSDLSDSPAFEFDFSLQPPDRKKADHFESSMRLKAKQLFAKIDRMREKNEASFSHLLFAAYPDRVVEDKVELGPLAARGFKMYEASQARQHLEPARSVVDLHIEKISEDWKRLSNYEILSLQLKIFEKYYDLALAHMLPSLVVIHGVGEGKLRDEIHDRLRLKREVKSFVNQYDPRYGFGATEIYFQY